MMLAIVRLECEKCMSHRDLHLGDFSYRWALSGVTMKVVWKAKEIGWRIWTDNGVEKCLCSRCK